MYYVYSIGKNTTPRPELFTDLPSARTRRIDRRCDIIRERYAGSIAQYLDDATREKVRIVDLDNVFDKDKEFILNNFADFLKPWEDYLKVKLNIEENKQLS